MIDSYGSELLDGDGAKGEMKINIATLIGATLLQSVAHAQPFVELPKDASGYYALGQRFATCAAHFGIRAEMAREFNAPETATQSEGYARGWKSAGLMFLAQGMDISRAWEAERTFDVLVEVKLGELKSRVELGASGKEIADEYGTECVPLVPTQEKLIEMMRRGPLPGSRR